LLLHITSTGRLSAEAFTTPADSASVYKLIRALTAGDRGFRQCNRFSARVITNKESLGLLRTCHGQRCSPSANANVGVYEGPGWGAKRRSPFREFRLQIKRFGTKGKRHVRFLPQVPTVTICTQSAGYPGSCFILHKSSQVLVWRSGVETLVQNWISGSLAYRRALTPQVNADLCTGFPARLAWDWSAVFHATHKHQLRLPAGNNIGRSCCPSLALGLQ
jgi:hypothetical protein